MQPTVPIIGGLPLVGSLPGFLRDPLATLQRAAADSDVSRLRLGFVDAVTLHHPEHAEHVLRKHQRKYTKDGPLWSSVRSLVGNGLPASQGDFWLRQRRMMQPQFHRRALEGLAGLVVDAIDRSLDWDEVSTDWGVVDLGPRMPLLTMQVVSAAMMGSSVSPQQAALVGRELGYATEHMFRAMLTDSLPRWLPMPGRRRFEDAVQSLRRIVGSIIADRRRRSDGSDDDLLALMIAATDEDTGEGMTDEQLLDETLSLFLAGYETTATGLQWALQLLVDHPEHLGRLREEADSVLRGCLPRFGDLRRLPYARWVMQEALRLYPPAWWIPRTALEDDEIGGYRIPAGSMVAPVTYTIHRNPAFWARPERFDPERFDPSRAAQRHPLAWLPFGAGPRQCIGKELSLMEATFALSLIVQRFELASVGPAPRPRLNMVLRPEHSVRLLARRRPPRRRAATLPWFPSSDSSSAMTM